MRIKGCAIPLNHRRWPSGKATAASTRGACGCRRSRMQGRSEDEIQELYRRSPPRQRSLLMQRSAHFERCWTDQPDFMWARRSQAFT